MLRIRIFDGAGKIIVDISEGETKNGAHDQRVNEMRVYGTGDLEITFSSPVHRGHGYAACSVRFTIGRLMAAVAVIAILLAWLDVRAAAALAGLGLVVIFPAAIAPPGRRLEAASWASSLQQAVMLLYLYATWATAWCVLGHCPRPSLDDPKYISPVVEVPYVMFAFSIFFGWIICICTGLLLTTACCVRRSNFRPLLALPFARLVGYFILFWDPLGVFYWYMD